MHKKQEIDVVLSIKDQFPVLRPTVMTNLAEKFTYTNTLEANV